MFRSENSVMLEAFYQKQSILKTNVEIMSTNYKKRKGIFNTVKILSNPIQINLLATMDQSATVVSR